MNQGIKNISARTVCLYGLTTAFVILGTIIIRIPVSVTNGYIHLGDSFIMIFAFFFGRKNAAVSGGVGSLLADVLSGYAHWAIPSLVIKAAMGFTMGALLDRGGHVYRPKNLLAIAAGILIMAGGYFIAGAAMTGSFLVSLTSVPANFIQGGAGACIYFVITLALQKRKSAARVL